MSVVCGKHNDGCRCCDRCVEERCARESAEAVAPLIAQQSNAIAKLEADRDALRAALRDFLAAYDSLDSYAFGHAAFRARALLEKP